MSCMFSLPNDVLRLLMQHVPLKDRLSSCCLVSKRLHAAAVAATDSLELERTPGQHAASALGWLAHYGQHLTRLDVRHFPQPLRRLPCENLLELKLDWGCDVQLGPAAGYPGVIQGCPKLTSMEVGGCRLTDAPASGAVDGNLSSLVHMQHLHVRYVRGLCTATLPCLQQLTCLDVNHLSDENLLQLSVLTSLQELQLHIHGDYAVGPNNFPDLSFPASLTKLVLWADVEAGILSLVTWLQELRIQNIELKGPAEGSGSLLSGMARLEHLTKLVIGGSELEWPPVCAAYSALTASTKLVRVAWYNAFLPDGAWLHVFAGTNRLPHLTSLELTYEDEDGACWEACPFWDSTDISCLVACCPSLCRIDILPMWPGLHVSELHQLTGLTHLSLDYAMTRFRYSRDKCFDSLVGLAAVTQLRSLHLSMGSPTRHVDSLLPLTRLTSLTTLCCATFDLFLQTTQAGSAPDVWLQLLERCGAASDPATMSTG